MGWERGSGDVSNGGEGEKGIESSGSIRGLIEREGEGAGDEVEKILKRKICS